MSPLFDPGPNKHQKRSVRLSTTLFVRDLAGPSRRSKEKEEKLFNNAGRHGDSRESDRALSLSFAIFRKDLPVFFDFEEVQIDPNPIISP